MGLPWGRSRSQFSIGKESIPLCLGSIELRDDASEAVLVRVTAGESFCGLVGEDAGEGFGVSILLTLSLTVEVIDKMSRTSAVIFLWCWSACAELAAAVGDDAEIITGGGLGLVLCRRGSLGEEGRTRL